MLDRDKIIGVLERESFGLCRGSLRTSSRTDSSSPALSCFIGALLYATGYTGEQLENLEPNLNGDREWDVATMSYHSVPNSDEADARLRLLEVYGMDGDAIEAGMEFNDFLEFVDPIDRRDEMIEWVKFYKPGVKARSQTHY